MKLYKGSPLMEATTKQHVCEDIEDWESLGHDAEGAE
jgi:hypothetical protein